LNGVPLQLTGSVVMNPLVADAIMNPDWPVVRSLSLVSKAWPPPRSGTSNMCTTIVSPGFIISVCEFGVSVARSASCGLGGPVGTPSRWMNAKLTGSKQLSLQVEPSGLHSRLSMLSAEHQWRLSQLMLSANGAKPGA
jgi:hypothetical protein